MALEGGANSPYAEYEDIQAGNIEIEHFFCKRWQNSVASSERHRH